MPRMQLARLALVHLAPSGGSCPKERLHSLAADLIKKVDPTLFLYPAPYTLHPKERLHSLAADLIKKVDPTLFLYPAPYTLHPKERLHSLAADLIKKVETPVVCVLPYMCDDMAHS